MIKLFEEFEQTLNEAKSTNIKKLIDVITKNGYHEPYDKAFCVGFKGKVLFPKEYLIDPTYRNNDYYCYRVSYYPGDDKFYFKYGCYSDIKTTKLLGKDIPDEFVQDIINAIEKQGKQGWNGSTIL